MECNCLFNGLCTSKIALFKSFTLEEQNAIINKAQHLKYNKGDTIFHESDTADKIIIVRYGKIKLNHYSLEGKEYVLDIIVESEIYGEQNIFSGENFKVNVIAVEPTGVCLISQSDIHKMIMNRPEVGVKLLSFVGSKLSQANELIEILSINDAKSKLAGFLLYRITRINKEMIELSREDISAYINLTRETISRKLSELEKDEIIQINGHKKIQILDKTALREIYENGK